MNLYSSGLEDHPGGSGNLNAILNSNWLAIHGWVNPANGMTASQATTNITSDTPVFRDDDVGALVRYADGTTVTLDGVTSSTIATTTTSQTKSSQAFELYRTDAVLFDAVVRGLTKRVRMVAGDEGKIVQWNSTLGRMSLEDPESYSPIRSEAYAASVEIDFADGQGVIQIGSLTGNLTLTTANRSAGLKKKVIILDDGTSRTLSLPSWRFMEAAAPGSTTINKIGVFELLCTDGNDSGIIARYTEEV